MSESFRSIPESPAPVAIEWLPRSHPLAPEGVAGWGMAALRLAARLLQRDDAPLAGLHGITSGDLLILLGPADDLPWADGVRYLGRDPEAPSLLLPTTLVPSAPLALFERAISARKGDAPPPVAVIPERSILVSLADARPVSRAALLRWFETCREGHDADSIRREER